MRARSASTTELRPATISDSSLLFGRRAGRGAPGFWPRWPERAAARSAAAFRLPAGWYSRSSALGVGPLPSRARRPRPPEPTFGPLLFLRTAPGRPCLFAIDAPMCAGGRVLERDARLG